MSDSKLAIAYSVKRKKKMANGGPVSAKTESRPSTETLGNDVKMERQNSGMKAPSQDKATDTTTQRQATANQRPGRMPIKHAAIMKGGTFTTKLRDQEDNLESLAMPDETTTDQPMAEYDEQGPDRQGPKVAALEMKKMADGGSVKNEDGLGKRDGLFTFPKGEAAADEVEMDEHASLSAAIMAKRMKLHAMIDSGSMDEDHAAEAMAKGGQIDLDMNGEEQPNGYYNQNEHAALKENYDSDMDDVSQPMNSNEHGDDIDSDDHDMIGSIRKKMKSRQF